MDEPILEEDDNNAGRGGFEINLPDIDLSGLGSASIEGNSSADAKIPDIAEVEGTDNTVSDASQAQIEDIMSGAPETHENKSADETDILMEVAPEIPISDEYEGGEVTDNNQSPEEILNDLMDDKQSSNDVGEGERKLGAINEMLDNMQDTSMEDDSSIENESSSEVAGGGLTEDDITDTSGLENILSEEQSKEEVEQPNTPDLNMEDALDASLDEELLSDNNSLGDGESVGDDTMDPDSLSLEDELSIVDKPPENGELSLEDAARRSMQDSAEENAVDIDSPEAAGIPEKEEASEDLDMADIDAIMNSLASDDIEDIESTSHIDEAAGEEVPNLDDAEIPMDDGLDLSLEEGIEGLDDEGAENGDDGQNPDLMDALTEDVPEDGMEGLDTDIPELDGVEDEMSPLDALNSDIDGGGQSGESDEEGEDKPKKKKGFLALLIEKIFKALTEEIPDKKAANKELASLTDENQKILDEMAGEKKDDGKKKKQKKEKKKKEKKPKPEKPKKEKKPKPPKPKKEKKPKPPADPEKSIAPRKVGIAAIFALSFGLLCSLPTILLPQKIILNGAMLQFRSGNYNETYKLMYGQQLTEEQSLMYNQARTLSWAQRYVDSYENYKSMNMEEEALNSLLSGVRQYSELTADAEQFQVENQVKSVYDNIESILESEYGLTSEDIAEINAIENKKEYTLKLMDVCGTLEAALE
nr:hypothetical protein [Butyrivibrio sp.]